MKMRAIFSRLHFKIAASFFALSLFLVILLSAAAYYFAYGMLLQSRQEQAEEAVIQASDYISGYLEKIKLLSDLIAMYPEIRQSLRAGDARSLEASSALVSLSAQSDPRIRTIAVISKNGFALTSRSDMAIPLSEDMMGESWYKGALQSNQMPVITSVRRGDFTMDRSDWVISVSHEIRDESGQHLGVVLIDISYRFIEDYIAGLDLGEKGYAYILDEEERAVYHPDERVFAEEALRKELEIEEQEKKRSEEGGFILTKAKIPHSHWTLVGISSTEATAELRRKLMEAMLLTGVLAMGASIVISLLVSRKISRPLVELQQAMRQVDQRWGHLSVAPKGSAEIEDLAREYNALLDRIKMLTEDIAQKENAKRIFELSALQSQINPHFLYNTLDTILWLAEFGENDKVVEVSKALGEMLRLSLDIRQSLVPLRQELAHTENYLKIQRQRYEDKISYHIEGEEELLTLSVPKLILQPIVENAIYHGIRPKKGAGRIEIFYRREGEELLLSVLDDGIGFSEGDLREGEDKNRIKTRLGGIGLKNVDQRIKILQGEEYGIRVEKREGGGTLVCYRLKIMEQQE